MLKYRPSLIAACAINLARKITQKNDSEWNGALMESTYYTE